MFAYRKISVSPEGEHERSPAPGFHGAMLICNAVFTDRERAAAREKINSPAKRGTPISLLRPRVYFPGFRGIRDRESNFVRLHCSRG